MIDFEQLDYLNNGNELQQKAYRLLTAHRIFEKLAAFQPVLTGTIPINIAIAVSDLDVICQWTTPQDFRQALISHFNEKKDFELREATVNGQQTIMANFKIEDLALEIFGQALPVQQQHAYRHMLIEHQILTDKGEHFRQQIVALKNQGYKTEPAFAQLLRLEGNPYEALLAYKIFRQATSADIKSMQIVRNSVNENRLSDPNLVSDADCEEFINHRGRGWVCEIDQQIVGFAIADLQAQNIWALFVLPQFEQQGIGQRLHQLMLDWYFAQGHLHVWLSTAPGTRAEAFYQKAGWKATGMQGKEIRFEMNLTDWKKRN